MLRTAFALALLVTIPSAAAQESMEGTMTFSNGFKTLEMDADITMGGPEAADMRNSIDQTGDGDGEATQEEVDAFMTQFGDMMGDSMEEELAGDDMQLDGKSPTDVRLDEFDMTGIAGPVESEEPITMTMGMTVTFAPGPGPKHTLLMKDSGEPQDGPTPEGELRIKGPSGYVIESYTQMAGVSLSGDKTTLIATGEATEGSGQDMTIVFAPPAADAKGSPAAGILVAALLVGLAAVTRRRA